MIATLPDCALIEALKFKAQQRNDTDFDYLGRLRDLRATVVAEVRSINELFPEYTPHDDAYHHANIDLTSDERFRDLGGSVRVSQKRLNFSYDDVFLPQDRDTAVNHPGFIGGQLV